MTAPVESVSFTLAVLAKPWQRAQHKGKQYFTPAESRAFKALVRDTFALHCGRSWRLDGQYALNVTALLPDWHTRDWDNIGKNVGDSLNGVAYRDDNQVVDGRVRKFVLPNIDGSPNVSVTVLVERIGDWPVKRKRVNTAVPVAGGVMHVHGERKPNARDMRAFKALGEAAAAHMRGGRSVR